MAHAFQTEGVGNQLLILLISFRTFAFLEHAGWESVTNPLDKLYIATLVVAEALGISY